jgi:tRNA-uridine 2-sulfurtransferase
MSQQKVVAALSGGVDSSVSAALLKEQGYDVIGLTLRLWTDPAHPPASRSEDAAQAAADRLGIPLHVVDVRDVFYHQVVQFFLDGYAAGLTPNPCVHCNRLVKWGILLQQAEALGADFLATGHYARKSILPNGEIQLLRAVDNSKDQTYVLHVLTQEKLAKALFPIGEHTKPDIRKKARALDLPAAQRAESQDLCFLAGEDYRDFIRRNAPQITQPGPILNRQGKSLGEHQGLAYYTIGQRKGLGVSSPSPLYVLAKDPKTNTLVVGSEDELGSSELTAGQVNWISGKAPEQPFRAEVKTRYTARLAWAQVTPLDAGKRVHVQFEKPQRDITPGQAAVFYNGDVLLGGGLIEELRIATQIG